MQARHHLLQSRASIATLGHAMTEAQLRELLSQETLAWAERSAANIVAELAKPQTYRRGTGDTWHEIEVTFSKPLTTTSTSRQAYMMAASYGRSRQ
jgi:hypothetical protein